VASAFGWRTTPSRAVRRGTSTVGAMGEMTCPQCQSAMAPRFLGDVTVHQCSSCRGVFLEHADLGNLIEAENDWHRDTGYTTQPLPRITPDMTVPPPSRPTARSYIETLFG
jgi:Zn-finger nucleic acid-binding protein